MRHTPYGCHSQIDPSQDASEISSLKTKNPHLSTARVCCRSEYTLEDWLSGYWQHIHPPFQHERQELPSAIDMEMN